ncbi:MAG: hypothetical protein R3F60_12600 [bacterium]
MLLRDDLDGVVRDEALARPVVELVDSLRDFATDPPREEALVHQLHHAQEQVQVVGHEVVVVEVEEVEGEAVFFANRCWARARMPVNRSTIRICGASKNRSLVTLQVISKTST